MSEIQAIRVEESDEESSQAEPSPRSKPLLICIIVVLVLGIGGALAWFFLTQNGEPQAQPASKASPTGAPTIRDVSSAPTDAPTIPLLFDPPSREDCIRIANQRAVSNQDRMITTPFGLDFDVTIVEGADTALWVATFMASLVRNLVPDLTGCTIRRMLLRESWRADDYYHRNLNEIRYAIGNVNVTGEFQLGRACDEDAPDPTCFRFVVKMDFYLKGEISNFQLIELVANIIDPPDSDKTVAQRLQLPTSLFESVAIVLLGSTSESPTEAPIAPSESPTGMPPGNMTNATLPSP